MKKILFVAVLVLFSITSLLFLSPARAYNDTSTLVPERMQPGSVIVFDENCNPTIEKGGYDFTMQRDSIEYEKPFQKRVEITPDMSEAEIALANFENSLCEEASKDLENSVKVDVIEIYPNMKVVYNPVSGYIDNILYKNENEPGGYSINNPQDPILLSNPVGGPFTWGRAGNTLWRSRNSGNVTGEGRATVFYDNIGNRDNYLGYLDCATQQYYDYSRVGDKDVYIRNLNTDQAFTFHQADVGALPNAIIDIWGDDGMALLAGQSGQGEVYKVRYFHERFSDQ